MGKAEVEIEDMREGRKGTDRETDTKYVNPMQCPRTDHITQRPEEDEGEQVERREV